MLTRADVIEGMRGHIERIHHRIGPRPACGEGERRCAEYIREAWRGRADRVDLEAFSCRPGADAAAFRWPTALFPLALLLYPRLPALSAACSTVALLILVFELILNRELIDRAFPEGRSANVVAEFAPRSDPTRTLLVTCHHDSSRAYPLMNRIGRSFFTLMTVVILSTALLALLSLLRSLGWITAPSPLSRVLETTAGPAFVLLSATVPVHLVVLFKAVSGEPTPGINDNLSGVAVCLLLAEHLAVPGNRPERTTVRLVSFGCEECGIRGSKRFVARHGEEIQDAWLLNLDMVAGKGTRLRVVTGEVGNLVRLSEEMGGIVRESARTRGVTLEAGPIMPYTDAMAFARRGTRATSLVALDERSLAPGYHSPGETLETLDYDLLFEAYRLTVAVVEAVDRGKEAAGDRPGPPAAHRAPG